MDSIQSMHALKPNLSQLLMRTFEQLEDPKYATVPKTHWDELRPSILSNYFDKVVEERDFKSERDLCKGGQDHDGSVCKTCLSTGDEGSDSIRSPRLSPKPFSFRALNWKIKPLWRYCAHAVHCRNGKCDICKAVAEQQKKTSTIFPNYDGEIQFNFYEEQKEKWRSQSFEELKKSQQQLHIPQQQYSTPAFEVMPPLYENRTHSLLYQNSYLLDGVKYDYISKKSKEQRAKLYLNYMRFLKSINKPTRPSDIDIVFGDAKIVSNPPPHWEGARIDWLLKLERKQEMRKLQLLERKKELNEKRKANELAKKEAKRTQKALKNAKIKHNKNPKNEVQPPTTVRTTCDECQSEKRKSFFLKRFKKPANFKTVPQVVELIPTI